MAYKLYHNPRCSKSRQALQILQDSNVDVEIFEYLKKPILINELKDIINKLGVSPRDIIRVKEIAYQSPSSKDDGLKLRLQTGL